MLPDQRTFVQAVMRHLGLTPTELGNRLGKPNAYNSVNAWVTTKPKNYRGLGFDDTVRMLDLCGWLNIDADDRDTAGIPRDPLSAIADGVAALEESQERMLQLLEQRATKQSPRQVSAKATT